jgi:hypothetical protein
MSVIPAVSEAEMEGLQFKDARAKKLARPYLKK